MVVVGAVAVDDALRRSRPNLPNFDAFVDDAGAVGGCGGDTPAVPPPSTDPLAVEETTDGGCAKVVSAVSCPTSEFDGVSSVDIKGSLLLSIIEGGLSDVVDVFRSPAPILRNRDISRRTVRSVVASSGVSSLTRLASSFSR